MELPCEVRPLQLRRIRPRKSARRAPSNGHMGLRLSFWMAVSIPFSGVHGSSMSSKRWGISKRASLSFLHDASLVQEPGGLAPVGTRAQCRNSCGDQRRPWAARRIWSPSVRSRPSRARHTRLVTIEEDLADVARTKEAHPVDLDEVGDVLLSHVCVRNCVALIVSGADGRSGHQYLAPWHADVWVVGVRQQIATLLPIAQPNASALGRRPNAARRVVGMMGDARDCGGFGEAVTLAHRAREDGRHKLLHLRRERGRAGPDELDLPTKCLGHLLPEEDGIERVGSAAAAPLPISRPVLEPHIDEAPEEPWQGAELGAHACHHLVQHNRCSEE
eukprot:scaffold155684_cov33-Tisochrysis_lutea.AAC.1